MRGYVFSLHEVTSRLDVGRQVASAIGGARLSIVEGAPHGLFVTHTARVNAKLLAFVRAA